MTSKRTRSAKRRVLSNRGRSNRKIRVKPVRAEVVNLLFQAGKFKVRVYRRTQGKRVDRKNNSQDVLRKTCRIVFDLFTLAIIANLIFSNQLNMTFAELLLAIHEIIF